MENFGSNHQLLSSSDAVIYFVQEGSSSFEMRRAYSTCQEAKLKPKIISEEESNAVPPAMNVVFVLEEFSGNTFKSLASSDSLVVGPTCLNFCVENEIPIPDNGSPVFNMAMKGLVITASRLTKSEKEEIIILIGYMGGVYTDQMTSAATHLISNEGKSPKCEKAVEHKLPIMRSDWVKAVWEASKKRNVSASDQEFSIYRLPPFKGMVISCSNIAPAIKNKIQKVVEAHGGVYTGPLEQNKTTALIIGEPDGKKFQAAQLWNIPCLTSDWIFDSASQGIPLPSKKYLVNSRPKCSTPTNELSSFMSNDMSCIPFANLSANNTIDETNSTVSSVSSFGSHLKNIPKPQPTKPALEYKKLVDEINLADAAAAGLFLDGCKVYLSGFGSQEFDKLKKLMNKSGATLFPEISDRLTHVILGEFLPEHVKEIEKLSQKPLVVSVGWILASIRLKTAAPAEPYLCFKLPEPKQGTVTKLAPTSPLSHKGLSLLKSNLSVESNKNTDENSTSIGKPFVKARIQRQVISTPNDLEDELLNRDKPHEQSSRPAVEATKTPPAKESSLVRQSEMSNRETAETEMSNDSSSLAIAPFLKGLVFLVIGFENPTNIIESLVAVGGKVESCNFQGIADYAVVPLDGVTTQLTATEIVTPLWVEDCYDQNKLVPIEYYHQPVALKSAAAPLSGCVICVSGYIGKERTFMFHLANSLGAVVQESFSRKDHRPRKDVRKSTHLICKVVDDCIWAIQNCSTIKQLCINTKAYPEKILRFIIKRRHVNCSKSPQHVCNWGCSHKTASGSKYNAAIQWGIPVVNESWLLACVSSGTLAPLRPHQFDDRGEPPVTPVNPAILRVKATEPAVSFIDSTPVRPAEVQNCGKVDDTARGESENKNSDSFVKPSTTPEWNASSRITQHTPPRTTSSPVQIEIGETNEANDNFSLRNSLCDDLTAFEGVSTPKDDRLRKSMLGSAGKSPFHVDTPSTPYGRVFMKEGENPSPDTRKKWKKYIDNLPDMHVLADSPEVQEFKRKRRSTPLHVVMKQVWVKFGKAEIDGIDPVTGDLLPDGPFGEWAHENTHIRSTVSEKQPTPHDNAKGVNSNMSREALNEEMSTLKSKLDTFLKSSQQKATEEELTTPSNVQREPANSASKSAESEWSTPKNIEAQPSRSEIYWDFGKPSVSVPSHKGAKKLKLSDAEADRSIDEQMTKLFETEKPQTKEEKKIFVLSQVPAAAKDKYESIIKNLGGEVCTTSCFDPKITHLVTEKVLRSEKLLCAVASGKWVLHSSYLTQCYQSRMFLPEEDYEWGNDRSRDRLPALQPNTTEWHLARAVHKWRVRRTDLGQPDAFRHFRAVILTSDAKLPQYMRLLQAGNATVLPKEKILEATHVFWDEDKVALSVDKNLLKSKRIPLLKPVYLGDYLAKNPPPSVDEYAIR